MNTTINAVGPTQNNNNEISDCRCAPCRCDGKNERLGAIIVLVFFVTWIAGMVFAKGFWSTLFAVIMPPWGWYLVVEKIILMCLGAAWLQ